MPSRLYRFNHPDQCRVAHRQWRKSRAQRGLCYDCPGFVEPGHVRCDQCRYLRRVTARLTRRLAKTDVERRFGRAARRLVRLRAAADRARRLALPTRSHKSAPSGAFAVKSASVETYSEV